MKLKGSLEKLQRRFLGSLKRHIFPAVLPVEVFALIWLFDIGVSLNGGFPQQTHGLNPTKNDHFGVEIGGTTI